ncbi:hypothetical protein BC834DRAFT_1045205 [Gloeopeniophorella convolvens]|nr:hypothetical protein BC834DRAFT_1045205 [Gloeopeniophorella convolvens]
MRRGLLPEAAHKKEKQEKRKAVPAEEIEPVLEGAVPEGLSADEPGAHDRRPSSRTHVLQRFKYSPVPEADLKKKKKREDKKSKKVAVAESAALDVDASGSSAPPIDVHLSNHLGATDSRKEKKKKRKRDDAAIPASKSASAVSPADAEAHFKTHSVTLHLPPSAPPLLPLSAFDALAMPAALRGAFAGFSAPTRVQACARPPALAGRDVVGIAETGSGKALAFGIPALVWLLGARCALRSRCSAASTSTHGYTGRLFIRTRLAFSTPSA